MIVSVLLLSLAALFATAAWRLPAAALGHALPVGPASAVPLAIWRTGAAALAAAALGGAWLDLRRRPPAARATAARLAAPLLIYPALLAALWAAPGRDRLSTGELAALAALLATALLLLRRAPAQAGFGRTACRPALRALAWPTLLLVTVPVVWGIGAGVRPRAGNVALSLIGYPIYALVQLTLFCVLPWPRLRALGASPAAAGTALALLFALVHWPNPALMAGCLLAMLVWTAVYQRHPSAPALALAMGLAATAFTQGLPADVTHHARVGPRYVRHHFLATLAAPAAAPAGPADTSDVTAWVRGIHPAVVGRAAAPAEAQAWADAVATRLRERIAWQFLTSDEMQQRRPDRAAPRTLRWTQTPAPWRGEIARLGAPAFRAQAGGDDTAFLRALYRELLGREASDGEIAAWRPALAPNGLQREALAAALWDHRHALARTPADPITASALRLP